MKIREKTVINCPPSEVWRYIVDPDLFRQWNEKIEHMDAQGAFRPGSPFTTHYIWGRKRLQCRSIATIIEEGRLLELRHTGCMGPGIDRGLEVIERITLEERGNRTVVIKHVHIKDKSLLSLLLAPLIWFVTRFGKPVKEDRLKTLCEGAAREKTPTEKQE